MIKILISVFVLLLLTSCSGYEQSYTTGYSPSVETNKYYYDNQMYYLQNGINTNRYSITEDQLSKNGDNQVIYIPVIITKTPPPE